MVLGFRDKFRAFRHGLKSELKKGVSFTSEMVGEAVSTAKQSLRENGLRSSGYYAIE